MFIYGRAYFGGGAYFFFFGGGELIIGILRYMTLFQISGRKLYVVKVTL